MAPTLGRTTGRRLATARCALDGLRTTRFAAECDTLTPSEVRNLAETARTAASRAGVIAIASQP